MLAEAINGSELHHVGLSGEPHPIGDQCGYKKKNSTHIIVIVTYNAVICTLPARFTMVFKATNS